MITKIRTVLSTVCYWPCSKVPYVGIWEYTQAQIKSVRSLRKLVLFLDFSLALHQLAVCSLSIMMALRESQIQPLLKRRQLLNKSSEKISVSVSMAHGQPSDKQQDRPEVQLELQRRHGVTGLTREPTSQAPAKLLVHPLSLLVRQTKVKLSMIPSFRKNLTTSNWNCCASNSKPLIGVPVSSARRPVRRPEFRSRRKGRIW
jgi:hypothetical protein